MSGEIDPPIIYGLEHQCRALTSLTLNDESASRFVVGTQSLGCDNLIYLFEYTEESNTLTNMVFKQPYGEAWHLASCAQHPNLLTAMISNPRHHEVILLRFPHDITGPMTDDDGLSNPGMEKVATLITANSGSQPDDYLTRQCLWQPEDGSQILTCNGAVINIWDAETQKEVVSVPLLEIPLYSINSDWSKITNSIFSLRWSPHSNCKVVAVSTGPHVLALDIRIPSKSQSSLCFALEDAHDQMVRSMDFNPNSQYYFATGGDDCRANFWDLRKKTSPCMSMLNHTHWIWSIRYNPFHDQLVLTSGSDTRVSLMRMQSIASEPFGHLLEDDDLDEACSPEASDKDEDSSQHDDGNNEIQKDQSDEAFQGVENTNPDGKIDRNRQILPDEVLNIYEDHDDSVYVAEWVSDPWIFVSLGFESRLVLNKVPKAEKFNILF